MGIILLHRKQNVNTDVIATRLSQTKHTALKNLLNRKTLEILDIKNSDRNTTATQDVNKIDLQGF